MYNAGVGTPYWYEWEVGLLECLKMMTDFSIQSVVLQSVNFESLDDVVVNYTDGSIVNIQVKHTDIGENFTYSTLISGERPMLEKWAKEWDSAKCQYNIKEIRIVTNRQWGTRGSAGKCSFKNFIENVWPSLQLDYGYQSDIPAETSAAEWFKKQISYLDQRAFDFIKILQFYQEDDLQGVELKIRKYVAQILGTEKREAVENATRNLLAKLSQWSTSQRKRQEIFREDIYNTLCVESISIPDYEIYPEKPIFPSRKVFSTTFIDDLQNTDKKVVFLRGLPGSGKTNFVSYLAQLDNSIVDFRFYTYLPVNKEHPSFSDDVGYYTGELLWRSILHQLKNCFEKHNILYKLGFPLIYNYLSVTEMRETVLKYLPEYAKIIGRTCYLFIDGLDHAARARDARNSFLSQLPLPDEINGDVKIVLVGQPINDKYPSGLVNNNQVYYVDLPVLGESDVVMLLSNEGINVADIDITSLSKSIIDVVGNNALNVLFAIREIKRLQYDNDFDAIVSALQERNLNSQIDKYYEWIISSITEGGLLLLKIKTIFAFASQKVKASDVADMCGAEIEDVVFVLNQLYPLIECNSSEYYTFHNDVRLFFKESILSNSNYQTLAFSIYKKITEKENLTQYSYDIAFETAFELENKQLIFELFSPEYIIKSIEYKVSVNKILQQFSSLMQLSVEMKSLDNIDKISFAASTISQYINNIQYNQKEDLFYDNRIKNEKTESEKYILSLEEKMNTIVYDIYTLLKKGFCDRAKKLFSEYLDSLTFDECLNGTKDDSDREYCERAGYICRFFAHDIMQQDVDVESDGYLKFVKGWLDASTEFCNAEDIDDTFTFKYYRFEFLNNFTAKICSQKRLDANAFDKLSSVYLSGANEKPISSLVDLCAYGILSGYDVNNIQKAILPRAIDILESNEFEFNSVKILYYLKYYFCLYYQFKDNKDIPKLYFDILECNHITLGDRAYLPAIDQFNLVKKISSDYYDGNANSDDQIKTIYDTAYFEQQHGTGSSHDCNAYDVMRFLKKVLFYTHSRKSQNKLLEICQGIKNMYVWKNPRYLLELSELFYIANDKEDYLSIAEHWCGQNGILWDISYADVEYIGVNIAQMLYQFGCIEMAQKAEKCVMFKLFGYVDHKDYSLSGLLECYKNLPLSEAKLHEQGMALLTVSDKARSIGDNRMAGEVEDALFETAVELEVKHVNALFELKNNPENFYDWRNCLLDAYYKKISVDMLSDSELVALYTIVNSWINEDIESSIERGNNQLDHLYHYNYKIIEHIKERKIKEKLKSLKKCSPSNSVHNIDDLVVKSEKSNQKIIDELRENGYSIDIEQRILTTFSDVYGGQSEFLINVGEIIDLSQNRSFISNCIVEYIVKRRKYGYRSAGLKQLIEAYYGYFLQEDWLRLFESISRLISTSNMDDFYSVNDDIETLCLNYYKGAIPDKLTMLYNNKVKTHWAWLTSCGLINVEPYILLVNENINSLADFSRYHIGRNIKI